MIDLLKFDLNDVKTVINPIFGLPTPHQQQVDRVRHGASLIRRFVLENSVPCPSGCECPLASGQSK